ncbi:hypothetical protein GCM10023165_26810 [Variovorax defluvii]|uniref:Uncharacterized protein n=1 Tax=Variovorax defluvii TaxID=913761 RepID=A0ABP8HT33_9BURK
MQHFAFLDQVLDRASHVLDRHSQIDAVLVVEVDAVGLQALERFLDHAADALGPAVQAVRAVNLEAELGGDGDVVAHRAQRFGHEFFVHVGTIDLGGVEEGDAALVGVADHADARRAVHARAVVAGAVAHAAEAQLRHLQLAQLALADGVRLDAAAMLRGLRQGGYCQRCGANG